MTEGDITKELSERSSLQGLVYQKLREGILSGKYHEKEELREAAIGEELGVSRTPVREAFRQLELEGLTVRCFQRDTDWFSYIFRNRRGQDSLDEDVILGPIANDTIFDTMGVLSSGFLAPEEALALLRIGPAYTQLALKTEQAAAHLRWLGAEPIVRLDSASRSREQEEYLKALGEAMAELL